MGVRRTWLGVQVIGVVPDGNETEIVYGSERGGTRTDDDHGLAPRQA